MKFAILGAGKHFKINIYQALTKVDNLEIIGLLNSTIDSTKLIAEELKLTPFSSIEELIWAKPDCVYIATPPGSHYKQIKEILKNDIHVLCEKSLTTNIDHWVELNKVARDRNLALFECFMFCYHPQFNEIKKIITSSDYGNLKSTHASFLIPHLDKDNFRYSRELGGGAIYDSGCYPLKAVEMLGLGDLTDISSVAHFDHDKFETSGMAIIKSKSINNFIEWGFGFEYKNALELTFEAARVYVNFSFSKKINQETNIVIKSQKNGDREITIKEADHFYLMFKDLIKKIDNPKLRIAKMDEDLIHARNLEKIKQSYLGK